MVLGDASGVSMRRPIQVLVYLAKVAGTGWEYLLLRRVPFPRLGTRVFWQGVTGAPEEGESLVEGASREVFEETGFTPAVIESVDYSYAYPVRDEWRHLYGPAIGELVEHVFVAVVVGGEPKLSREHDAWRWCAIDEALRLLAIPGYEPPIPGYAGNTAEALRRCRRLLSKRRGH